MCGIVALWDPALERGAREAWVRALAARVRHRGPDDDGAWSADAPPLSLGFRRLAIQGLGAQGAQPMAAPGGEGVLVFNGELFDAGPLRRELERRGARFHGSSDTEILMHAIATWGVPGAVERVHGQFALAWLDARARRLFLVRDRVGIRPLYYAQAGDRLAVASEQKALLPLDWVDRSPNLAAALRFLALSRTDDVPFETMARGIASLPAGHWASWDGAALHVERYARVPTDPPTTTTDDLRAELERAVASQLVGEVPLGAMVSGGLDSSTVALLADKRRVAQGRTDVLHLFAYHDASAEHDERRYQNAVFDAMESPHEVHWISSTPEELAASFDVYVDHQEEPYGDVSSYAEFCVARHARDHGVKVLLSGLGGDEVFVGYPSYFGALTRQLVLGREVRALSDLFGAVSAIEGGAPGARRRLVLAAAYHSAPGVVRNVVTALRSGRAAGLRARHARTIVADAIEHWHRHDGEHPTNAVLRGSIESWSLPRYLLHSDRMTLAFGVEGRVPLLDDGVIRAAFGIPARERIGPNGAKDSLRRAVADILPAAVRERAWKLGFHAPLTPYVRALEPRLREGHAFASAVIGAGVPWSDLELGERWRWGTLGAYLRWVRDQPLAGELAGAA